MAEISAEGGHMGLVEEAIATLRSEGMTGEISDQHVIVAIQARTVQPSPVPSYADDTDDFRPLLSAMSPDQRRRLGMRVPAQRLTRPSLRRTIRFDTETDSAPPRRAPRALGPASFGPVLDGIGAALDAVAEADIEPRLRIRLHAIATTNEDGLMADGSAPRSKQDLAATLADMVEGANQVFESANIELVFYPSIDLEIRNDPGLNYDWWLDPHDPRLWKNPPLTPDEVAELALDSGRSFNRDPFRDDEARKLSGKLIFLIAEGQAFIRPHDGWRWCPKCQGLSRRDGPTKCPAGNAHYDQGSGNYVLFPVSDKQLGERRWQVCGLCRGLFFAGGTGGRCPGGGPHASGPDLGLYKYTLLRNRSDKPGESNWRRCTKCEGLFLASHSHGVCPTGGEHTPDGTANYTITINEPGPWLMLAPGGPWYSDIGREFVRGHPDMTSANGDTLAHEIGHYLNLAHTHGDFLTLTWAEYVDPSMTAEQKMRLAESRMRDGYTFKGKTYKGLRQHVNSGYTPDKAVEELFDYDYDHGVTDTPGDCGELAMAVWNDAWQATDGTDAHESKCGPLEAFIVSSEDASEPIATVHPNRSNIMSYFGCPNVTRSFSRDQAVRMREALTNGKRRHLVDVQLGVTRAPDEFRCGVWDPSDQIQAIAMGYSPDDFTKLHVQNEAAGLRLVSQQGYLLKGRKDVRWDGVWTKATHKQVVIRGWDTDDFVGEREKQLALGMRLVHLQSYVLPDGAARINAIWNPGDGGENFALGYTDDDLRSRANELSAQGLGITHLNGWNLPDGQIRFDAIFREGATHNDFITGWAVEDLAKKYTELWGKKIKFHMLDSCLADGQIRYNAIWTPHPGGQVVVWQMTQEQVLNWHEELGAQGGHLRSLNAVRMPSGQSDKGSS